MNNDFNDELMALFREEAHEIIERIATSLVELEESTSEQSKELYAKLHRDFHTLKGSAGAVGMYGVADVVHELEDFLVQFPAEYFHGELDAIEILQRAADFLFDSLQEFDDLKAASLLQELHETQASLEKSPKSPPVVEKAPLSTPQSNPLSSKTDVAFVEKESVQAESKNAPVREGVPTSSPDNIASDAVESVPQERSVVVQEQSTVRVQTNKLEVMQSHVGELVIVSLQQQDAQKQLRLLHEESVLELTKLQQISGKLREYRHEIPSKAWFFFEQFVQQFSSSLKESNRSLFQLSQAASRSSRQIQLLSDSMEAGFRDIRMMPVGPFLETFRRTVREAARAVDKKVQLKLTSGDIEVDRQVLESLREPLLHLLRNAVAHGIEPEEERLRRGKSPEGTIRIHAGLAGKRVHITISDDGGGISKESVLQKAQQMELYTEYTKLTDKQLLELLCHPGFTTSTQVNQIAGRGVGMDVVLNSILDLQGKLELTTKAGVGTEFHLTLPLSLTTTHGLILKAGEYDFGIPLHSIEHIVRHSADEIKEIEGVPVVRFQNEWVAVRSLLGLLGEKESLSLGEHLFPVIVLRVGDNRLALVVDEVVEVIPMLLKPLGPQLKFKEVFSGGTICPDGSVLIVLSARILVSLSRGGIDRLADKTHRDEKEENGASSAKSILIVDDSFSIRTLERSILESNGFVVREAVNRVQALESLENDDSIALVVTDLDMPEMNGLELCRRIRAGSRKRLPVIIMTSHGSQEEKEKGLEAGADAYLVKRNFQQHKFLQTIKRLIL
jgi:chemotaxis protein histidine kinase CheA